MQLCPGFDGRFADNVVFRNNTYSFRGKPLVIAKRCGKIEADGATIVRR